jgi:hypothetical protein
MISKKLLLPVSIHLLTMALCFGCSPAGASSKTKLEKPKSPAVMATSQTGKNTLVIKPRKDEKTILCSDEKVQRVRVTFGRITTLNFPVAPKEVLPGEAVFDFKQIRNDLNIKALSPRAKTNIAVYLQERRCSLDLVTVPSGGDDILFVRDPAEKQFEVRFE